MGVARRGLAALKNDTRSSWFALTWRFVSVLKPPVWGKLKTIFVKGVWGLRAFRWVLDSFVASMAWRIVTSVLVVGGVVVVCDGCSSSEEEMPFHSVSESPVSETRMAGLDVLRRCISFRVSPTFGYLLFKVCSSSYDVATTEVTL